MSSFDKGFKFFIAFSGALLTMFGIYGFYRRSKPKNNDEKGDDIDVKGKPSKKPYESDQYKIDYDFPDIEEFHNDVSKSLQLIKSKFGRDIARKVEQIYRLETRDFKSMQFKATNGAGTNAAFGGQILWPYGWNANYIKNVWNSDRLLSPVGLWRVSGKKDWSYEEDKVFLVYPSFYAGAYHVARFLKFHANNPVSDVGRWNSTDPNRQRWYRDKVYEQSFEIVG